MADVERADRQGGVRLARTHKQEPFPAEIDCETNSPVFAHCYWIQMMKFDPRERNDVLPSTKLAGANGASLDLGGFGYKPTSRDRACWSRCCRRSTAAR